MLGRLGWSESDDHLVKSLKANKKTVLIFPHTSYWDMIIAMAFINESESFKGLKNKVRIIVRDEVHNHPIVGSTIRSFGSIPAGDPLKGGSGTLKTIFEELDKLDEFILLISPKGTRFKGEWKRGWYNIASRYDAGVITAGADFSIQKVKMIGDVYKINGRSIEEMEVILKHNVSKIISLNPKSEINGEKYNKIETNVINPEVTQSYLIIGLILFILITVSLSR